MADTPKKPAQNWLKGYETPFLVLGIAFIVMSIAFMFNDTIRPTGFAFLPIGLVFIVLSISAIDAKKRAAQNPPPPVDPAP